MSGGFYEICRV